MRRVARVHSPTPRRRRRRRGTSVVEALVALLLGLFIVCLALTVVARQRAVVASMSRAAEALSAVRVARELLGAEGRDGDPVRDGWAVSADSLSLRGFRGTGYVCGPGPTPLDVVVEAEGVRLPQPAKDSVLLLDGSGRWRALALEAVSPAVPCLPDGGVDAELWRLSAPVPADALLARYFERGSYHVTGRALRYRRGLSGRQPLTPGVLKTPGSGFRSSAGRVALLLEMQGSPVPWRVAIPWESAGGEGGVAGAGGSGPAAGGPGGPGGG